MAVGHRAITAGGTLVERFDGSSWKAETSADPPTAMPASELWAVSAPSAGAQWAVGESHQQGNPRTLAERNPGGGWS